MSKRPELRTGLGTHELLKSGCWATELTGTTVSSWSTVGQDSVKVYKWADLFSSSIKATALSEGLPVDSSYIPALPFLEDTGTANFLRL